MFLGWVVESSPRSLPGTSYPMHLILLCLFWPSCGHFAWRWDPGAERRFPAPWGYLPQAMGSVAPTCPQAPGDFWRDQCGNSWAETLLLSVLLEARG